MKCEHIILWANHRIEYNQKKLDEDKVVFETNKKIYRQSWQYKYFKCIFGDYSLSSLDWADSYAWMYRERIAQSKTFIEKATYLIKVGNENFSFPEHYHKDRWEEAFYHWCFENNIPKD